MQPASRRPALLLGLLLLLPPLAQSAGAAATSSASAWRLPPQLAAQRWRRAESAAVTLRRSVRLLAARGATAEKGQPLQAGRATAALAAEAATLARRRGLHADGVQASQPAPAPLAMAASTLPPVQAAEPGTVPAQAGSTVATASASVTGFSATDSAGASLPAGHPPAAVAQRAGVATGAAAGSASLPASPRAMGFWQKADNRFAVAMGAVVAILLVTAFIMACGMRRRRRRRSAGSTRQVVPKAQPAPQSYWVASFRADTAEKPASGNPPLPLCTRPPRFPGPLPSADTCASLPPVGGSRVRHGCGSLSRSEQQSVLAALAPMLTQQLAQLWRHACCRRDPAGGQRTQSMRRDRSRAAGRHVSGPGRPPASSAVAPQSSPADVEAVEASTSQSIAIAPASSASKECSQTHLPAAGSPRSSTPALSGLGAHTLASVTDAGRRPAAPTIGSRQAARSQAAAAARPSKFTDLPSTIVLPTRQHQVGSPRQLLPAAALPLSTAAARPPAPTTSSHRRSSSFPRGTGLEARLQVTGRSSSESSREGPDPLDLLRAHMARTPVRAPPRRLHHASPPALPAGPSNRAARGGAGGEAKKHAHLAVSCQPPAPGTPRPRSRGLPATASWPQLGLLLHDVPPRPAQQAIAGWPAAPPRAAAAWPVTPVRLGAHAAGCVQPARHTRRSPRPHGDAIGPPPGGAPAKGGCEPPGVGPASILAAALQPLSDGLAPRTPLPRAAPRRALYMQGPGVPGAHSQTA